MNFIPFTCAVTFIFPWAHMLCVAESSRSAQRRPSAPADGSGSYLCGWAPAASWEWKAHGCPESTERTVELHGQPRGEDSLLSQHPSAQERHFLQWFKQPGCCGLALNFFIYWSVNTLNLEGCFTPFYGAVDMYAWYWNRNDLKSSNKFSLIDWPHGPFFWSRNARKYNRLNLTSSHLNFLSFYFQDKYKDFKLWFVDWFDQLIEASQMVNSQIKYYWPVSKFYSVQQHLDKDIFRAEQKEKHIQSRIF